MQHEPTADDAVVDRLQDWLVDRFGGRIVPATPVTISGDGFDSTCRATTRHPRRLPSVERARRGLERLRDRLDRRGRD